MVCFTEETRKSRRGSLDQCFVKTKETVIATKQSYSKVKEVGFEKGMFLKKKS